MRFFVMFGLLLAAACGSSTGLEYVPTDASREGGVDGGPDSGCNPETCNGLDDDCDGFADDGLFCFFLDGAPIAAAARGTCGPEWYSYDVPDEASANPVPDIRVSGQVVVGVQAGPASCGAYVAVIADLPMDGTGGALDGSFQITEGTAADVAVGDEPRECSFNEAAGLATCEWEWAPCCTDGVLLGPFREDFCLTAVLSNPEGVGRLNVLDGPRRQLQASFGQPLEICGQFREAR